MFKKNQRHVVVNAIHVKSGGGLVFFHKIMPLLVKDKSFKVSVVAHKNQIKSLNLPRAVTVVPVDYDERFISMLLWEQLALPKLVRSIGGEVTFNLASFAPLMAPKPVVYISNNPNVRHYARSFAEKVYWYALVFMARLSVLVSPLSISNGEYVKSQYFGGVWKFLAHKVIDVHTASDVSLKKMPKKVEGKIVAVGDFYKQKDYITLLKAFKRLLAKHEGIELHVIGRPIDKEVEKDVSGYIQMHDLSPYVKLRGGLPHDETLKEVASAELYVSTSDAESYSLTLLEAMQVGTAAVVKGHGFQKEVGLDLVRYSLVSDNKMLEVESFAKQMSQVLSVKNDDMVLKAQKQASSYTWKDTASRVLSVLKQV